MSRLSKRDGGFLLETTGGPVVARQVLVATGGFHKPKIPAVAAALSQRMTQLHTHNYTDESALPAGAVLIVGSGQSGVQIAEELQAAGRRVYLSVGSAGRMPRRYRGSDIVWWLAQCERRGAEFGAPLPTVEMLPDPRMRFAANPHLSGHGGGHETNLRRMAAEGINLLGHLDGIDGDRPRVRALAEEARGSIVLVLGTVFTLAISGTIEGFVTGSTLPTAARVGIGIAVEVAFLAWVVLCGRAARSRI